MTAGSWQDDDLDHHLDLLEGALRELPETDAAGASDRKNRHILPIGHLHVELSYFENELDSRGLDVVSVTDSRGARANFTQIPRASVLIALVRAWNAELDAQPQRDDF